jgi:hypothetical protein
VAAHQIEELAILLFDGADNLDLLRCGQRRQISSACSNPSR